MKLLPSARAPWLLLSTFAAFFAIPAVYGQETEDLLSQRGTATSIGTGSVLNGAPIVLHSTPPIIGEACSLAITGAPAHGQGYMFVSAWTNSSINLGHALLYIDVPTSLLVGRFSTDGQGTWLVHAPLTLHEVWAGSQYLLQAVIFPALDDDGNFSQTKYVLTNAMLWTVGLPPTQTNLLHRVK